MAHFTYDGFSIAYEQRGRKEGARERPFLLLHGLLFSSKHNQYMADVLAERGNRVILMDFLGHGESDQPTHSRHYNMELFARQALGLMDHLDIPEAVVGGTSLGANVTLDDPAPSAAVVHGILTGRIAPHPSDREKMDVPAFVVGHRRDILHPLSDAEALARELPNSRLVEARNFFELRLPPNHLLDVLADFLDEVWSR